MAQVTISFEADLRKAVESFVGMARRVKDLDGGLGELTRTAGKAATELEKAASAKGKGAKAAKEQSEAVSGLISHFSSIVSVGAAVYKAIDYINSAHAEGKERARAYADELRGLLQVHKDLAGASNYNLKDTLANRQLAGRLGTQAKVDARTALAGTAKGLHEGYGPADILAALQYSRVSGVDPTQFFETLGKSQKAGSPISGVDAANLLLRLQDPNGIGASGAEALELGDKVITGGTQSGLTSLQALQLAATAGEILPGKKAAGALSKLFDAVKPYEASSGTGKNKTTWMQAFEGTLPQRLAQLKYERPDKWAELAGDPEIAALLPSIGDALATRPAGDELARAVRARDADTGMQGPDLEAQASSATMATEAAEGQKYMRAEAKKKLLLAALTQAGRGDLYKKFATGTIPDLVAQFGGLDVLEAEMDKAAAEAKVSLDPSRVVEGTAARSVQIGPGAFITPAELAEIESRATEQGHLKARDFRAFGVGPWIKDNMVPADEGWSKSYEENRKRLVEEELQRRRDEIQEQMLRETKSLGRWNGSLRDWRAEDNLYSNPGYGDTSARRYLG